MQSDRKADNDVGIIAGDVTWAREQITWSVNRAPPGELSHHNLFEPYTVPCHASKRGSVDPAAIFNTTTLSGVRSNALSALLTNRNIFQRFRQKCSQRKKDLTGKNSSATACDVKGQAEKRPLADRLASEIKSQKKMSRTGAKCRLSDRPTAACSE